MNYNTAEYRRSDGPAFHGAATAWVAGKTGQGSIIGIIDTGIYQGNSEFTGRISADSTDIYDSRNQVEGEGDHGTLVAMIAAADNNGGNGTVGIAYDATILSIRADTPGTCATGECTFGELSSAIDYAIAHNATVINMSLGGSGASGAEVAAIKRAADAGIVVVVAAGNDGRTAPDGFARDLVDAGGGNVIIVGSVNSAGVISDFSNKARGYTNFYLAALGEDVTVYLDGPQWAGDQYCPSPTLCAISGTSFAAPQVAGAVALIAQAFPNLTATEIVELLLTTAQDVGTPGVDNTYGRGILDIHEAFQPQGTTTLASKGTAALPLTDTTAVGSPAMGDALTSASLNTLILDKYRRAFSYNLGLSMRSATLPTRLYDAIGIQTRSVSSTSDKAAIAYTIDASNPNAVRGIPSQLMLTKQEAETSRVLAARVALKLAPDTQLGFAYAERPDGLVMQMQGQDRPAFLIAGAAGSDDGTFHRADMSLALRKQFGGWGLTLAGESGAVMSGNSLWLTEDVTGSRTRDAMHSFSITADRQWGGLQAALGLEWMQESRTVLGGRFHDAFGGGGANTLFLDASAGWEFAPRWKLFGSVRNGWTYANSSSVIENGSVIQSRAWSIDIQRRGVFSQSDSLGLRVAQPMRVESGGLKLSLPVSYDYDTESATFGTVPLSLAPDGREILGELAWHGPLWGGGASASVYYRRDPGHYESMPDDQGVALRWSKGF
ncbi:hypothetical protein SZ64_10735 [Erythrobacter sp. SG61-1L]|nr:hypothetical protein SZ64_10735 [Erythrobacter sp. SG61-1L]